MEKGCSKSGNASVRRGMIHGNTLVTIDCTNTITLSGVNGVGANGVTIADFLLHA